MEYVVGFWFLCGIGSGIVAESKGRSGCGWLILGFLLGPIGLVISAGMSNLKQAAQLEAIAADRQREQSSTRACPQCAEQIQRAAVKCRFCGTAVEPLRPTMQSPDDRGLGYAVGRAITETKLSAWWLIGIGAVLILIAKSCNG